MNHFVVDLLVAAAGAVIFAVTTPEKPARLGGYLFLAGVIAALLQR